MTAYIVAGWSAFMGSHLIMSHPPIREKLIEKMGKDNFLGVYSVVAIGTLAPTIYAYTKFGRKGATLWNGETNKILSIAGNSLKGLAAVTLSQAVNNLSPVSMAEQMQKVKKIEPYEAKGILRITRHPLFGSLAFWGLGNCLIHGRIIDLVFYGGFPLFWIIGSIHQDYRLKKTLPEELYKQTSILPFQAIIEGRNSLSLALKEMSIKSALIGIGVWLAFRFIQSLDIDFIVSFKLIALPSLDRWGN